MNLWAELDAAELARCGGAKHAASITYAEEGEGTWVEWLSRDPARIARLKAVACNKQAWAPIRMMGRKQGWYRFA